MPIQRAARSILSFALLVALHCASFAQQTAQPPTSAPAAAQSPDPDNQQSSGSAQSSPQGTTHATQKKQAPAASAGETGAATSNDRLFFALPNFLTLENGGKVPPLTSGQKFRVVARSAFDYVQFAWYGFLAGVSQAENSEPGFGQGWEGYGKRYASAFADGTIENFMTAAVLPSLLHQDPRFFQSGKGGFGRRTEYAVSRILITRTDSGHSQFNYSEILGSALAAAISTNTYHPRAFISKRFDPNTQMVTYIHNASDRTLPNTLSVWGTQVGYDTITIVIKEFWPDVHRKLSHKHRAESVQPGNPNQ